MSHNAIEDEEKRLRNILLEQVNLKRLLKIQPFLDQKEERCRCRQQSANF
jgi:hypothetical protein